MALLLSCTGDIGEPNLGLSGQDGLGSAARGGPNGTAGTSAAGASAGGSAGAGTSPGGDGTGARADVFAPAPAALRRLSAEQYGNSVRALLGDVTLTTVLEPDTTLNGFVEIGTARATVSPSALEKYETAAFELAAQALAPGRREAFVGCTPSDVIDTACTRAFVTRFGRRAFRRPLTDAERDRYVAVASNAASALSDFHAGIEFAVAGLLQSPNFLFRVELGEPDPEKPDRLRYTDYEMATRLSFLFWNTTPDDALLDAAEAGELTTDTGLAAQVDRLIADPRTREAMDNFHAERLGIEDLSDLAKDGELFPQMSEALGAAMRDDILRTLDDLSFANARDFRDVFVTRVAFVDSRLAALYGLDAPTRGTVRAELPEQGLRRGLLGKAGLLAQNAHVRHTSPTLRGKFVRERVLCQSIPAPPNDVVTVIPEPSADAPTMRDRLEAHRSVPLCAGCHVLMDPIGLSFENFDAVGAFRETDHGHALDVSGDLDGTAFDDPRELAELLRETPAAIECTVRQLYRYAVAHVETAGERPVIEALHQTFADSGYAWQDLLRAVAESEGFRYAAQEEMP
jgi:hypothetical protein